MPRHTSFMKCIFSKYRLMKTNKETSDFQKFISFATKLQFKSSVKTSNEESLLYARQRIIGVQNLQLNPITSFSSFIDEHYSFCFLTFLVLIENTFIGNCEVYCY